MYQNYHLFNSNKWHTNQRGSSLDFCLACIHKSVMFLHDECRNQVAWQDFDVEVEKSIKSHSWTRFVLDRIPLPTFLLQFLVHMEAFPVMYSIYVCVHVSICNNYNTISTQTKISLKTKERFLVRNINLTVLWVYSKDLSKEEHTLYTGPKPPSPILLEKEKWFVAISIVVKS